MQVTLKPIESVTPYERNARKISQAAVDKVAKSLQEFGWQQPIVVDKAGVIIVGHTRLLAAKKLGLKKVPVHVAKDLTPAQVKAYRIADNRTNQEATWDFELLAPELAELVELNVSLDLTGFDDHELGPLMAADWKPAAAEGDLGADHKRTGKPLTIPVTADQLGVIEQGARKVRLMSNDESISLGRCLELMAADYLAS